MLNANHYQQACLTDNFQNKTAFVADIFPADAIVVGVGAVIMTAQAMAKVEPTCQSYLEARYRTMPYLYSAVHE